MRIYLIVFFCFLLNSCESQTTTKEQELMNCIYNSCADKGSELKEVINNYENELVLCRILADNSSESYIELLEKIKNGHNFVLKPKSNFNTDLNNLNYFKLDSIKKCFSNIEKSSKIISFQKKMSDLYTLENINYSKFSNELLMILDNDKNIEDYYKFNILIFFNDTNLDTDSGINNLLPTSDFSKNTVVYSYLDIELNENDEILINKEKISSSELENLAIDFIKKNESKTRFRLNFDGNTKYSFYIYVQNILILSINKTRDNYSIKNYNKPFDKLNFNEKKLVIEMFPNSIVDNL
jgi:biopolymer transport protein ExbD